MPKLTAVFIFITILCVCSAYGQAPIFSERSQDTTARTYNNIIAVVGAFQDELTILQSQMQNKKEQIIQHIHFTEGTLNGKKVVLAQTGIGKVNAAITTTLLIEHFQPKELIFSGIAGGINPTLSPGDLVIGTTVAYHDYGTILADSMLLRPTRNPTSMRENPIYFPCDSNLVQSAILAVKDIQLDKINGLNGSYLPKIIAGTIVTGDVFVSSFPATQRLRKQMNAEATEMEGAAVAQTCWQQQVPFLVIRSLSDNANSNASYDVKTFYQIAAKNAASLVLAILSKEK